MSRYILIVAIVVLVVIVLSAIVGSVRDNSKRDTGGEETKSASRLPNMISKSGGDDTRTSPSQGKTIADVVKGMRTVDDYFITAQMLAQVEKTFEGKVPTQKEQEDFVDSIMIQKKKFMSGTNQIEFRLLSREALLAILFPKK